MNLPVPYGDPDGVDEEQLFRSGFHPTQARPIPSMQCTGVVRNGPNAGNQCQKRALLGTTVCPSHGAQLPAVKKAAEEVLAQARAQLLFNSARVPDMLLDLAENSASDAVRLGAMNSLLDRAGLKTATDINVKVETGQSPHDVLAERMKKLRERVVEGQVVHTSDDDGDTVVHEEDPLHPSSEEST